MTVPVGGSATCTINNVDQPAQLTLVKTVTNNNGGTAVPTDWTLAAAGPTPISGTTGSVAVTNAPVSAGTYTLSESGGPAGYASAGWTCSTSGSTVVTSVTVPVGGSATCTINNVDQPAQLTLIKTVTNNNGGTAVPTDWTLAAAGPTPISGTTGSVAVTNAPVSAGTYTLSESGGPAGYASAGWTCSTSGSTVVTSVTVPVGGSATCTINNVDQPAQLTLIKTVTNNNGGTAVPTDWTLAAAGPTPISGTTGSVAVTNAPVSAGTYTLSESGGPAGYASAGWTCSTSGSTVVTSVTVPVGGSATCTINNDDIAGTWTISKASNPTSGSTVQPGDVITYTVTARKLTGVDPVNVVVNDDLSNVLNNATFVEGSISATTGTATLSGTTLAWTIPTLSGTQTVSYQVKVNAGAYGVSIGNVVTSPGSTPCVPPLGESAAAASVRALLAPPAIAALAADDPADCTTTTHDTPAWSLAKSSDPASGSTVPVGSTITYTLVATNTYGPPVTGAIAIDDLTAVLAHGTLVAVPDGATLAGTFLTWQIPTLAAKGDTATLTYQVKLNSDAYNVTVKNVATPGPGGTCTTCTTNHQTPPPGVVPPELPKTGADLLPVLWWAGLLLLLGTAALVLSRRRRVV